MVIPSWNGKHLLGPCLDSLRRQTFKDFDVLVVENGSTDGSVDFLRSNYAEVDVLQLERNQGFAGGVNAGIRAAQTPYVALLNNDANADPGWLEALVARLDGHPQAGGCTSKILMVNAEGTASEIDSTGDFYTTWGLPFPRGRGEIDRHQYAQAEEVFGGSGGATLYRASLFEAIGLFDEAFFAYFEDVDLAFRARLAGYAHYYEPAAVVHHELGATSAGLGSFRRYHGIKNICYVYVKNMPGRLFWRYLPRFVLSQLLLLASSIRQRLFVVHLKALGRVVITLPSVLAARRGVQRGRAIGVTEIDGWLVKGLPPLQRHSIRRLLRRGSQVSG